MAETERIAVTIAVDDDATGALQAVLHRLEKAGLERAEAQEALGTITGEVRPDLVAQLERVAGVSCVERSRMNRALSDRGSEPP
jgi:hypothetical protein